MVKKHRMPFVVSEEVFSPEQENIFAESNPFLVLKGALAMEHPVSGKKVKKKQSAEYSAKPVEQLAKFATQTVKSVTQAVKPAFAQVSQSSFGMFGKKVTEEQENRLFLRAMDATVPLKKQTQKVSAKVAAIQEQTSQKQTPQEQTASVAQVPAPAVKQQAVSMEQEEALFLAAMNGVSSVAGKGRDVLPQVSTVSFQPVLQCKEPLIEFTVEYTNEFISGHVMGLDLALVSSLRAGQIAQEDHIDLHGFTVEQAYMQLLQSIKAAYYKGHKALLVVTGQGFNSPFGVGLIRQRVQDWLVQKPLKQVVLAFCTAKPNDGGNGALYILLRKQKKNSARIAWDITPNID